MRDYGKVSPQFWIGKTGKSLRKQGLEAVIVGMYLMTSPNSNMIGLYYLPIVTIAHETGLGMEGASKGLQRAIEAGFCAYDYEAEMVWVYEMAKYQIANQLKPDDKRCIGIQNEYNDLPDNQHLCGFYEKYASAFNLKNKRENPSPIEAPCKPHRSQEQEQEQDITTLSGKPDVISQAREVIDYLNEKADRNYEYADANIRLITARIKESGLDKVKSVIDHKCSEWGDDEKMEKYLRPATLFNATKFASYAGDVSSDHVPVWER